MRFRNRKMNQLLSIIFVLLLMNGVAEANDSCFPGDIVDITIAVLENPENAVMILFHLEYDHEALQAINSNTVRMDRGSLFDSEGISVGKSLILSFCVQKGAAGEYPIRIVVDQAVNIDEQYVAVPVFNTPIICVANELVPNVIPGEYIALGTYPQTAEGTDNTPIEWLVLDVKDNKALLVSRYALDCKPYDNVFRNITWEECSLRAWLNNQFIRKAFSASEQEAIMTTAVDNSRNQGNKGYNTDGGYNTPDKIFLLSYMEAWQYFTDNITRECIPTDYAINRGADVNPDNMTNGQSTCAWWLRSPGDFQLRAIFIDCNGFSDSSIVNYNGKAVRPALWIDLNAEVF